MTDPTSTPPGEPSNPSAAQPPPGYPPGYPPPYGYGYPPYQPPRSTNEFAIASLICAFFCAPLGIVFGVIARNQIRQSGESGDGLALAGIIVSVVQLVFLVLWFAFVVSVVHTSGTVVPLR